MAYLRCLLIFTHVHGERDQTAPRWFEFSARQFFEVVV
jgi:hypothetical protein